MTEKFELHRYDDIIDLPPHVSPSRPRMSRADRAAQFSPFAALTGYGAAVQEAARLTDTRGSMTEEMKTLIDARLRILQEHPDPQPRVSVTYFRPDDKKTGGAHVTLVGEVRRIDTFDRYVIMQDGSSIAIDAIEAIEGEIFDPVEW